MPDTVTPADAISPLVSTTELTRLAISSVVTSKEADLMRSAALQVECIPARRWCSCTATM